MNRTENFLEKEEKKSEWNEKRIGSKNKKNLLFLRKTENFKTRFWCRVEQYTTLNKKRCLFSSCYKHQLRTDISLILIYKRGSYLVSEIEKPQITGYNSQKDFSKNSCIYFLIFYNNCVLESLLIEISLDLMRH